MKAVGVPHQYACFTCRKSFKRPQFSGASSRFMTGQQAEAQIQETREFEEKRLYKCPDCAGLAHFMGIDFKAPKKSDDRGWREAQAHIESGRIYYRGTDASQS